MADLGFFGRGGQCPHWIGSAAVSVHLYGLHLILNFLQGGIAATDEMW